MVFWEFFSHLVSFDLVWVLEFILNNTFWLFGFIAAAYYMSNGKNTILGFIVASLLIMLSLQFLDIFQLLIYTAVGLALLYLARLAILLALEKTQGGSKYIPLGWIISWFAVLFLYNAFLV